MGPGFWLYVEVLQSLYFCGEKVPSLLFYAETRNKPLKFGKIQKYTKNVQNSLWGIEPGPTDPELGVYTSTPWLINYKNSVEFWKGIEHLVVGIKEQCTPAHT